MRGILVLGYHRVGDPIRGPLSRYMVTPERLDEQLKDLHARGFRFLDFPALRRVLAGEEEPAHPCAFVTFDDGCADNLHVAAPILEENRCPAAFFVVTDRVGGFNDWEVSDPSSRARLMDWDDLRELGRRGFSVGSHTRSHARLPELDDRVLERELRGSLETLRERLEVACPALAYPYGMWDARVVRAAGASGYELAFTVKRGFARLGSPPLRIPRCEVFASDGKWRFAWKSRVGWRLVETARSVRDGAAGLGVGHASPESG